MFGELNIFLYLRSDFGLNRFENTHYHGLSEICG